MAQSIDIIYVGDPMCSWCWGISEEMRTLEQYVTQKNMNFTILVGGLRVGGGQAWDDEFKGFLRHHWQQVSDASGQPFGFDLFDLADFDYDTQYACRAVVAVKNMLADGNNQGTKTLDFFVAVSRKFYVDNQDPKQVNFYQSICQVQNLDFNVFSEKFNSDDIKSQTTAEFNITRNWGVSGYPTLIHSDGQQLKLISSGFQKADGLIASLDQLNIE